MLSAKTICHLISVKVFPSAAYRKQVQREAAKSIWHITFVNLGPSYKRSAEHDSFCQLGALSWPYPRSSSPCLSSWLECDIHAGVIPRLTKEDLVREPMPPLASDDSEAGIGKNTNTCAEGFPPHQGGTLEEQQAGRKGHSQ